MPDSRPDSVKNLYLGTCSWKYPSWQGLLYSSAEPANYLEEYARNYSTVEVDQWFWSLGKSSAALPRKETVAEYDAATPADFRFTVKCPNAITLSHHRGKKGEPLTPNDLFLDTEFFLRFLGSVGPLVPKIGLFIFQFEYLNQQKMPSKQAFFERIEGFAQSLPADLPYAFEIRNPRWMDDGWFALLERHDFAPVFLQGYWMDDVATSIQKHFNRIGRRVCLRLHGEDREGMEERTGEDWSAIIRPKDDELGPILETVVRLIDGGRQVFLNVNNHYEGSAPLTIGKIRRMLG